MDAEIKQTEDVKHGLSANQLEQANSKLDPSASVNLSALQKWHSSAFFRSPMVTNALIIFSSQENKLLDSLSLSSWYQSLPGRHVLSANMVNEQMGES